MIKDLTSLIEEFVQINMEADSPIELPLCIQKCCKCCPKRIACCLNFKHIWCEDRQIEVVLENNFKSKKYWVESPG
jgi:hypothetical protein